MSKASQDALAGLHGLLAKAFSSIIAEGVEIIGKDGSAQRVTAPAAYLKEAREFLKDNGVEALPTANKDIQNLAATLPFPSIEEEEGTFVAH